MRKRTTLVEVWLTAVVYEEGRDARWEAAAAVERESDSAQGGERVPARAQEE